MTSPEYKEPTDLPILRELVSFSRIRKPGSLPGTPFEWSAYTRYRATEVVLSQAVLQLGVTYYQLSFLLGTSSKDTVLDWKAGRRRPSSLFMHRLTFLYQLKLMGVNLAMIRRINWEDAEIIWRNSTGGRKVEYDESGTLTPERRIGQTA